MKALLIILCIILPPLAVYLHTRQGKTTLLNVVLTLLCGLPGMIHALIVVLKPPQSGPPQAGPQQAGPPAA